MESMFWSAGVAGSGLGGLSELTMEAFLFANDSSESVAGTDLWRMGVFGSTNSDGTGAKFGYIPQILEGKPASQTFVTGLPLPITARFRFPIADLGCNEFGYMCVEFSRGENAQPFFPFTTNSGHDVFVSCRQAPCDPNANMNRVGIGNVTWGVRLATIRRDAPSDVKVSVNMFIMPGSGQISGSGMWRIGLFGSPSANGSSGDRFNYVRQLLSPTESSRSTGPNMALGFPSLITQFDVLSLGCTQFKYLCIEIAKGDHPQPDFVFHNDAQNPITLCRSVSCQIPDPGSPPPPQARLAAIEWNLVTVKLRVGSPSNVSLGVIVNASAQSSLVSGEGLWRLGFFASAEADGSGTRHQYQRQILSDSLASLPISPQVPLVFQSVGTTIDVTGMGCPNSRFSYLCIVFAKGDSPIPDYELALRNGEAVTCKRISCQPSLPTMPTERALQSNQRQATFQNINVNWQTDNYRRDGLSDVRVTVNLIPDTGTDAIYGNRLWRMGLYASDSSQGTGTKYAYQRNVLDSTAMQTPLVPPRDPGVTPPPLTLIGDTRFDLREICEIPNRHPYFCVEFAKNDQSSVDFTIPIQGGIIKICRSFTCPASAGQGPVARYSDFSASIDPYSIGSNGDARMTVTLTVNPSSNTDTISGEGLWRVGVFASNDAAGSSRYSETRNILDYIAARKYMAPNRQMQLRGSLTFPAGDLGCVYSHLCIEFAKGDSPSTQFTMQSSVSCVAQECQIHGLTARYTDFSASTNPYSADSSGNARMTITLNVNPSSNTDTITGDGLWRVGVFGSDDSRGSSRYAEIRNILDSSASRRAMRPSRPMSLPGSFDFPAADLGCVYQYFCIEFAKGNNPSTDFQMQSSVACQPQSCQGGTGGTGGTGGSGGTGSTGGTGGTGGSGGTGGTGGTGGNGGTGGTGSSSDPTVTIRSLSWAIQGQGMRPDGSTNLAVETSVSMDPSTSPFGGPGSSNLWKMGIFASSDAEGSDRYDEIPQILTGENRYREIRSGRATAFNTNTRMDIQNLGCVANKRYFCVEFGQGNSPRPRYTMRAGGGPLRTSIVSCKRQECNQEQRVVINSVRPSLITIRAGEENDVSFDVDIRQDPQQTSRIQGSNLWKLQAWGSKANTDSGPQISAVDQVLSAFQADSTLDPTSPFGFTSVRYNLDMRGRTCKEVKFLCTRIQKDRPSPDYQLQAKNNDASNLLGCLKLRCTGVDGLPFSTTSPDAVTSIPSLDPILPPSTPTAAPKPMFTVKSLGIQRVPNAAFRAGQSNRVSLTVSVNYDRARTTDISNPGWRLDVWASSKKNGKGPKVSPSRLDLGYEESRDFTVPSVLRFNNHNYDLDLNGQSCSKNTNFLCVKMTKTGAGFALKGKPRKALTKCSPINCFDVEGGGTNPGPNPPSGGGRPHVRLSSVRASFRPTGTQMNMDYYVTAAADSDVPTGKNLWHLAAFLSDRSDGSGSNKYGYTNNVLAPKQAKTVIAPGRETSITDIRFDFPSSEIGCYPYYFLCVEFGKGTATNYDMVVPATGKLVSCSRQTCQQK